MELTNEYFVCVFVLFVFLLYVILIKSLQGYVILFYNGGNSNKLYVYNSTHAVLY